MWYPYELYLINNSTVIDEETGEVSSHPNAEEFISKGRDDVSSTGKAGKVIQGTDGESIVFNAVIHLPRNTTPIEVGKEIVLYQDASKSRIRIKGKVLRFSDDSQHCRIWV